MSRFIVIEGLDGAGTTTQTARLTETLSKRSLSVLATREPTNGPVGRILRSVLRGDADAPALETLPWLFAADRADHLYRSVLPALAAGTWVISDRYYHSSLAYQMLTLPFQQIRDLNRAFRAPDLTVFLDVTVDACLERISNRPEKEIFEERSRLEAIDLNYQKVLAELRFQGENIVTIDGLQSPDEVERDILAAVDR